MTENIPMQTSVDYTRQMIQEGQSWNLPDSSQMRNAPNRPAQYPIIMPDVRQFTNYIPVVPPMRLANNFLTHSANMEGRGRPIKADALSSFRARQQEENTIKASTRSVAKKPNTNSIFNIKK